MPEWLPIDDHVDEIVATLRVSRALVLSAAPGAGKTTRVPPALVEDGAVIVLQPRRVAARSIARRVAEERGWTIGREVGWHVRFERQFARDTRLLIATEGILTARLQQDPLLSDFHTIVLDEFHERSIHADLGIALARQAWLARDDLRLVVMSATMDTRRVAAYLGGCPIVDVPGRGHPIDVQYAPGEPIARSVTRMLAETSGQILCFLPGAGEIRRAREQIAPAVRGDVDVVELHGSLSSPEQDNAIAPVPRRRIILATNIAETSLTVPGVTGVIDTGQQKVARYDPDRAIDSLETERITQDSADQRAGRAGRTAPGVARRLWDRGDRLRPHREPDIMRVDLCGPLLDILAWGGDPDTLEWFEPPPQDAIRAGYALLAQLGALDGRTVTTIGREMQRLPLHPRLARILIEANGARDAALACALLSERHTVPTSDAGTTSDLLSAIAHPERVPPHVIRVAEKLMGNRDGARDSKDSRLDERTFRRAVLAGYPDRVGKRRASGSPRVLMASGTGAVVGPQSGVRDGDYLVALDVTAGRRGEASEALIRMASIVEREWLRPTSTRVEHEFDDAGGAVRAFGRDYYGAFVLRERHVDADPDEAARMLADAYRARPRQDAEVQLERRLRFAGIDVSFDSLVRDAAYGKRNVKDIDVYEALPWTVRQQLERDAPERIPVPSGRTAALVYEDDGSVSAEVKLQELFGLPETPRVGPRAEPVLLSLLAPNGRPVQMTRDLRSFWERTYPEVRKELRGRYPRHPWPEDPWTAAPTARTKRRQTGSN